MTVIAWGDMVFVANGRVHSVSAVNGVSGQYIRGHSPIARRKSSTQTLLIEIHRAAAAHWKSLTSSQVAAWTTYAGTLTHTNPVNGVTYTPSAYKAYIDLATLYMRLNSSYTPPTTPPTSPFTGDTISITVSGNPPFIEWIASGNNAPDVTTILLLHRFTGRNLKHNAVRLSIAGFNSYQSGIVVARVRVPRTARYDTGWQFVRTSTGQLAPRVQGPFVDIFL